MLSLDSRIPIDTCGFCVQELERVDALKTLGKDITIDLWLIEGKYHIMSCTERKVNKK